MDGKFGLVLLLTLPASLCGLGAEVRKTTPIFRGWKGKDIRLPCHFQGEPEAVIWVKDSSSSELERTTKAGFIYGNFDSWEKGFDIDKNFSLVITDLEVVDEGLYLCQVVLTNSEDFELSNLLTVSSRASKHAIEECVDKKTQSRQSRCTYHIPNTATLNLTCVVSGFKPNISLLWTEDTGKKVNSVNSRQKMLSDLTYERIETITVSAIHGREQTFLCIATGDSLNGTSTKEVTLLPISGKRDNVGFIVGLIIGVAVPVSIFFLLVGKFLHKYHPHFIPRKGCGWNPCRQRPEPERVDEEKSLILAPPSPSLTKEQVEQIKEELKAYYRLSRRKVTVDPLNFMYRVNLDDIYTNLSLLDQSDIRNITPITYEDLLNNDGSLNLSKRLLIQGEGGVGKTTLCSKIAWDWCQGRILQDLDMVVIIPLRDVTDGKSFGGLVQKYFTDSNLATEAQIDRYILNNVNRILIVFDGFDEFNEKIEEGSSSEIIRILGLEQYQSCKVIVTTRPWRRHEFTVVKSVAEAYTFIRVDGFNKDNLRIYIKKYFGIRKDTLAENLITFMEENEVIQSNMAPFPIFCAMLCLMWEEFSEERRNEMTKMQTFSEISGEMITFLEEHYASKACQSLENRKAVEHLKVADRAIQDISKIALNGVLQNNMTFNEDQFRECRDAMEICCRIGVLTIERDAIKRGRRRDVNIQSIVSSKVSFPHKLFQEYIARVYIQKVYMDNRAKYDQLKNKLLAKFEKFRFLLYFITTLRNEIPLDIISGLTKCADQYFCVDVAFECHTKEAAKAVGERWDEYKLFPDMSEHTKSGVVFMVQCNQAQSLRIDRFNCGRTLLLDLAEGICSSTVLREVTMDLFNSKCQTDFYNIVAVKASTCQIQDLALNISYWNDNLQYQSSMGKDLARWVCTMPHLSSFSVTCHTVPDGFFSTAADMVQSCQVCELLILIESDQISESAATAAAEFLCHLSHLRSARITCDNLPRTFFTTIASQTPTCKEQNNVDGTLIPPLVLTHDHSTVTVTKAVKDHDADLKISSESRRTDFYTAVRLDDNE